MVTFEWTHVVDAFEANPDASWGEPPLGSRLKGIWIHLKRINDMRSFKANHAMGAFGWRNSNSQNRGFFTKSHRHLPTSPDFRDPFLNRFRTFCEAESRYSVQKGWAYNHFGVEFSCPYSNHFLKLLEISVFCQILMRFEQVRLGKLG